MSIDKIFDFIFKSFFFIFLCFGVTFTRSDDTIKSQHETIYAYPTSCKYLDENELQRNIIQIQVKYEVKPFYVKCNQEIEGGGWTYILNRFDGSQDFNLNWDDSVNGIGNINQEFFIGLKKLHEMTTSTLHELLFVMEDFDNDTRIARYDAFAIDDETNAYTINILGNYSGTAGDCFTYHSGRKFSTKNKDFTDGCVKERDSPGWFNRCSYSNIFGHYLNGSYEDKPGTDARGMYWFRGPKYSLKSLSMLIRPVF